MQELPGLALLHSINDTLVEAIPQIPAVARAHTGAITPEAYVRWHSLVPPKKTVQWMCRQIPMKHDKRLCALSFQKAGRAFVLGCPRDAPPIRYGCMASGRGSHLRLAPIRKGGSDCQAHGSGISSFQSAVILRGEDARTFLTDPCGDSLQSCSPAQAFLTFNLITQCHVRAFPDGRRCLCPPLLCMLYPET